MIFAKECPECEHPFAGMALFEDYTEYQCADCRAVWREEK